MRTQRAGDTRSHAALTTAARRMPVPVADSQDRLYFASSVTGLGTTGAVRTTVLCSPGTSQLGVTRFSAFLASGSPQTNTKAVSSAHGTQACVTAWRVSGGPSGTPNSASGASWV